MVSLALTSCCVGTARRLGQPGPTFSGLTALSVDSPYPEWAELGHGGLSGLCVLKERPGSRFASQGRPPGRGDADAS